MITELDTDNFDAATGEPGVPPELAHCLGVQGIPAVLLFKDGQMMDRMVGAAGKAQLSNFVKQHQG